MIYPSFLICQLYGRSSGIVEMPHRRTADDPASWGMNLGMTDWVFNVDVFYLVSVVAAYVVGSRIYRINQT